jgi:hypothetical protein
LLIDRFELCALVFAQSLEVVPDIRTQAGVVRQIHHFERVQGVVVPLVILVVEVAIDVEELLAGSFPHRPVDGLPPPTP